MSPASSADPPLSRHTVYLLSQLGRAGRNEATRALAAHDLTMRDMAALAVLEETGLIPLAELGRRLGLDPSDVTSLVDELCATSRVARTVDPADRRRRLVRLTRGGSRALQTARRVITEVDRELLAPLPPASRTELHNALVTLLEHQRRF